MDADAPEAEYAYGPELLPDASDGQDDIWRWRRLLPLDGSDSYPLQVGGTPLLHPRSLRDTLGLPGLVLKDETRTPTGSNKDRATALCVVDAARRGAAGIAAASSGNVAVSLAAGGAAAGLPAYLFVSGRSVAPSKVDLMRAFGATVFLVDGSYEAAYRLSEAACERFGWYSRNTGANPLAVEGKKTVAFEVWEQLGRIMPRVVYLPVGDGVTLAAYARGCRELVHCRVAERVPRIVGVQASGAAPLADAFARGQSSWTPVQPRTIADGIAVGDPCYGGPAIDAVRATSGEFVRVDDADLQAAVAMLARTTGLLAERQRRVTGRRHGPPKGGRALDGTVVALITATGLKDQRWLPRESGRAIEVAPDLDALAARL